MASRVGGTARTVPIGPISHVRISGARKKTVVGKPTALPMNRRFVWMLYGQL
ncbi:hypothetical protein [Amycolatopsis sp. NPDC058986]|uniref:hypothetical protein n=1 Tax=unclassified Amycolatopsis TaxID=2618356 RepID=UPI003672E880